MFTKQQGGPCGWSQRTPHLSRLTSYSLTASLVPVLDGSVQKSAGSEFLHSDSSIGSIGQGIRLDKEDHHDNVSEATVITQVGVRPGSREGQSTGLDGMR